MSDVLDRPSALAEGAPETPPISPIARRIPVRGIAVAAFLAVLAWWLFVADTAADNDVIGGLSPNASNEIIEDPRIVLAPPADPPADVAENSLVAECGEGSLLRAA